jgi:UrcA family protein
MTYRKTLAMCAAVAITAGGLAVIVPPAFAKNRTVVVTAQESQVTRRVSYADLNLAAASGEKILHHRVGSAVGDLCNEATGGQDGTVRIKLEMKYCSTSAWDGAQPQIDRAIQRAREIAAKGSSSIAAAAITISLTR